MGDSFGIKNIRQLHSGAVLTVVVFDHTADAGEGDFRRDVIAAIIQHPYLIVLDRICPLGAHVSDGQRVTSCGSVGK